jgi:hypothetical protein
MKKIFTLLFAAVLVSAAAFAQDGRHGVYNGSRYDNSWQQSYPSVNAYSYSNPYGYGNVYGTTGIYDRRQQWRERERERAYERMMRRRLANERLYRTNRSGVSLQVTIGGRRPLY